MIVSSFQNAPKCLLIGFNGLLSRFIVQIFHFIYFHFISFHYISYKSPRYIYVTAGWTDIPFSARWWWWKWLYIAISCHSILFASSLLLPSSISPLFVYRIRWIQNQKESMSSVKSFYCDSEMTRHDHGEYSNSALSNIRSSWVKGNAHTASDVSPCVEERRKSDRLMERQIDKRTEWQTDRNTEGEPTGETNESDRFGFICLVFRSSGRFQSAIEL